MAASRTTFEKLQRDRAKKAKAEAKRAKRLGQAPEGLISTETEVEEGASTEFGVEEVISAADLLKMVETLQAQFDNNEIDFDEYEERKIELFTRLPVD
ncbi:MAG: hypothetical protein ACKVHU_19595 [Acidimicrobiales bacterium]|jgi:hypothetical protein